MSTGTPGAHDPTPRRPPDVTAVARALGVPVDSVRVAEGTPLAGARSSLTAAFRVHQADPKRPARAIVLPYRDPAWIAATREWLAMEEACQRAWWTWARDELGRDTTGVWRVAPLVEPPAEAIRRFDVPDDVPLPGLVRPWLDWPDVASAALSDERLTALWAPLREVLLGVIRTTTGLAIDIPPDPLQRLDLRRRLLTDGRTLAPTSFRPYLAACRALDDARPRVTG